MRRGACQRMLWKQVILAIQWLHTTRAYFCSHSMPREAGRGLWLLKPLRGTVFIQTDEGFIWTSVSKFTVEWEGFGEGTLAPTVSSQQWPHTSVHISLVKTSPKVIPNFNGEKYNSPMCLEEELAVFDEPTLMLPQNEEPGESPGCP